MSAAGIYMVSEPDVGRQTYYAVAVDADESLLEALDERSRDQALAGLDAIALSSVAELRSVLDPSGPRPRERWRWALAAAVGLLFCETLLTRRQARAEVKPEIAGA